MQKNKLCKINSQRFLLCIIIIIIRFVFCFWIRVKIKLRGESSRGICVGKYLDKMYNV